MLRKLAPLAFGLALVAGACSRDNTPKTDSALNSDLSLAAQQQKTALDTLSAAERANALTGAPAVAAAAPRTSSTPVRRTTSTTTRRRTSSGSSGGSSSGTTSSSSGTVSSSSGEVVVK